MGEQLLSGDLPVVGGGPLGRRDAELSLLHADDAAKAFADAIERDSTDDQSASGGTAESNVTDLYHVVDDQPVTVADFFSAFAAELDAPSPRRIPGWVARFFVGTEQVNVLTKPFPTDADRFRRETGWEPAYPTYQEELAQIVETWVNEGTIRKTASGYEWLGRAARGKNATKHAPRT